MKRNGYTLAAAVTALVFSAILATAPGPLCASGKVHVVVKGDTLWDISSFYIYDPFQWPQIWSANRDIENPHLIYPGQEIFIPDLEARVAPAPREARPPLPAPESVPDTGTAPESAPEAGTESQTEPEPEPVEIAEEVKEEMILAMSTYGFIVEDAEIGLGKITSAEEGRKLITSGMKVYIETEKEPLLKERRYSIVRIFDKVQHPVTKKKVGYLAKNLGDINVVDSNKDITTAIVGEVYKEIVVGDQVIEHLDYLTWIPKEKSNLPVGLSGYVIINAEGKSVMGLGDIVFIDLGIEDGLQTGDIFNLLGESKEVGNTRTPPEIIGELQVVVPRPGTAVARITRSIMEIKKGTEVVRGAR